jgi:hypothetical protein
VFSLRGGQGLYRMELMLPFNSPIFFLSAHLYSMAHRVRAVVIFCIIFAVTFLLSLFNAPGTKKKKKKKLVFLESKA